MVIDTSIIIEFLRSKNKRKTTLYNIPNNVQLHISTMTLFELYIGATTKEKWNDIVTLTKDLNILSINDAVAKKAANIYHDLKSENKLIDFRDIFIAATAIVNNLTIATLNKNHFNRIKEVELY
ncbi:MAG: type II toxin-antitoxin system VapC family toxin [bacterium]